MITTVESIRIEENVVDMTALETGWVGNKKKKDWPTEKEHKPENPEGEEWPAVAVPPVVDVSVGESEVDPEGPGAPDPPAEVDN
jgi:hypothetical protein